jgi:hypothetical protein
LLRGIFRTKNLDEILASVGGPQFGLKRTLTAFSVTLIGIGAIIGAGIFATVGTAASGTAERAGAGPSLMLSFVITAIVCGFTALCYAELASMVPISGSAYTYSYATLGELVAWIIGWDLIIEYAIGNVAVAISWAEFFNRLLRNLGIHVPDWLTQTIAPQPRNTCCRATHLRRSDSLQHPGVRHRGADHGRAGLGYQRVVELQRGHGADQDPRAAVLHRSRALLRFAGDDD